MDSLVDSTCEFGDGAVVFVDALVKIVRELFEEYRFPRVVARDVVVHERGWIPE